MSDGDSDAKDVVGVELHVVDYVIPVGLRTREEISPEIIFHASTGVYEEVRTVDVDLAAVDRATSEFVVEQNGLTANASHKIAARPLVEAGCINGVHVVEEGPVRLKGVIDGLLVAKGKFGVETAMPG